MESPRSAKVPEYSIFLCVKTIESPLLNFGRRLIHQNVGISNAWESDRSECADAVVIYVFVCVFF